MELKTPFVREAGEGPSAVCLHANASSSGQWRTLMDELSPSFRVFAPDLYGSGRSPDWPSKTRIALSDEVRFLEPVFETAGAPVTLIGHSYGAAVALIAALTYPERVSALALYEPTLFSIVDADGPSPNDVDGIRRAAADSLEFLDHGYADAAAETFIDYWSGAGTWMAIPSARKAPIVTAIENVGRWGHALLSEPTPLAAFGSLNIPVLYMVGNETPLPAKAVADLLIGVLPKVEVVRFEGLGHMGPVTHPAAVNDAIRSFIARANVDGRLVERAA